ncbi:MAG: AAA family ATPase, partial [Planctomycetes bacterium]|nr:AAA family ATPase [Planctomycetota bacterium]
GILRQGETMNIVAAPKVGKSWLVLDMALAIATGRPWLDTYQCAQGRVLVIDNELHRRTSANRYLKICTARHMDPTAPGDQLQFCNLRGQLKDIHAILQQVMEKGPGYFSTVIIDAWYRAMPIGTDENDNGSIAMLYNAIDRCAEITGASFILIHHTSKGNQSGKSVTDLGAGAGSQARAADVHLGLRAHKESGAIILDAAVRSWKPIQPTCLRFHFPLWSPDDSLDPTDLDTGKARRQKKNVEVHPEEKWTAQRFAETFLTDTLKSQHWIIDDAQGEQVSERRAKRLLHAAIEQGLAYEWPTPANAANAYARIPPPIDSEHNAEQRILNVIANHPTMSTKEVSALCDVSVRRVQQIKRNHLETTLQNEMGNEMGNEINAK